MTTPSRRKPNGSEERSYMWWIMVIMQRRVILCQSRAVICNGVWVYDNVLPATPKASVHTLLGTIQDNPRVASLLARKLTRHYQPNQEFNC